MGGLCQVPKIMYTIFYAFNNTLLIVIIVRLSERLYQYYMSAFQDAPKPWIVRFILLEGFTNFSVDCWS